MELDYERRHQHMAYVYESIMQAQRVKIDDIPLPMGSGAHLTPSFIDLPPTAPPPTLPFLPQAPPSSTSDATITAVPKSILKTVNSNVTSNSSNIFNMSSTNKELLLKHANLFDGIPQAPSNMQAPDLDEFECEDDENELGLTLDDHFSKQIDKSKKIRFNETIVSDAAQMTTSSLPPPPPIPLSIPQPTMQTSSVPAMPLQQLPTTASMVSPYLSGKMAQQQQQQQQHV